jgi:Cu(I)/Ag(I) efflux system membrane fusion protein
MKRIKMFSNKYFRYSVLLILGIFVGWIFFHPSHKNETKHDHSADTLQGIASEQNTTWTCAMHPQIKLNEPGDCPICGMDLIPLAQSSSTSVDPAMIHLSKEAAQLANVLTSFVTRGKAVKEVRLYGKVQADERLLQSQVAHIPGRIEKLLVNFTGEQVIEGQKLAEIYSPELITAQQELLETAKTEELQPELYEASREKLRLWKLTDDQIETIEKSGQVKSTIDVVSNTNGVVTVRMVNNGDYVSQGTALFKIADLSKVWILFDAYESDLQFLRKGEKISFTLQALPGKEYKGTIEFVDPVIDPVTRVAKVRVETANKSGNFKPEMFATGIVSSNLAEYSNSVVIPRSAVLWTGKRSLVYVKQPETEEALFKMREVGLGPMLGESYVVTDGLNEGEEIVTSGTFSVDAAAQLEGKPSMMNTGGGKVSTGHDHGSITNQGQDMPDNPREEIIGKSDIKKINVNMDFIMQLNNVYDSYIELKNALVASDANKSKQAASKIQQTLSKIDMSLLKGDAHNQWMRMLDNLNLHLKAISSSGAIESQRTSFAGLSDALYAAVKTFGLMGKTAYYQFCPMANNSKGSYWLSEKKDIQNPYYGESMLTCGETKETLKF